MFVWQAKITLAAANPAIIAASQSPGAGAITLTSTPVILDAPRQVLITSGGDDSGITFTVVGTGIGGTTLSETVTGGNAAAVATTQDFKTVASVAHSGAVAGTVSVGTNTTGSTSWFQVNTWAQQTDIGVGVVMPTGTTGQVEYTYDDISKPFTGPFPLAWLKTTFGTAGLISANADGAFTSAVNAIRLTVLSGTGTAIIQIIQSDSVGGG